jgi:hypothetical protein
MPWLRRLDLETWASTLFELGRTDAPTSACRFVERAGHWRVEDAGGPHGTWVNGHRVAGQALRHGDAVWLRDELFVYLASRPWSNPDIERGIDEAPLEPARVRVWADWLLERGDALGEQLTGSGAGPGELEGLEALVKCGQLELGWANGLIQQARVRAVDDTTWRSGDVVARLLSLRVARWLRSLTIDVCSWVIPSTLRLQSEVGALLRGLAQGPELPQLQALSFGYLTEPVESSVFLESLTQRVRRRFPLLGAGPLLSRVHQAWLEVKVPEGVTLHHHGQRQRIPLESGVWVGATSYQEVRAMPPGVHRSGVLESFIVRQQAPLWCLIPVEPGLLLNGRPAFSTRLLPGDELVDPRGLRYVFGVR